MKQLIEQVRQRIMQQLVTSLIYEDVVHYEQLPHEDDGCDTYTIEGEAVTYRVQLQQSDSFERLRISAPVWRIADGEEAVTLDYAQLLREVRFTFDKDEQKLEDFIIELLQTELKDTQAQRYRAQQSQMSLTAFDDYESYAMEAICITQVINHGSALHWTTMYAMVRISAPHFNCSGLRLHRIMWKRRYPRVSIQLHCFNVSSVQRR